MCDIKNEDSFDSNSKRPRNCVAKKVWGVIEKKKIT